jgi:Zn-dependent protease with chaperone function
MDFFTRQDKARKSTGLLMFYFGLAVVLTVLLGYILPIIGWHAYQANTSTAGQDIPLQWWYPEAFLLVCGVTLVVVLSGAMFKISQLHHGGGGGVAEMLGGRQVRPETDDFFEKRLRNVVEEMAIAAGVPVPPVYVLDHEKGINAFAAGFSPSDSVVAVTYGTMTGLTRDELQGVIAHEFSHIFNNDMRINLNLMGFLHGLLIIGLTGRVLLQFIGYGYSGRSRRNSKDSGQIVFAVMAAAITLMVVGFAGYFFCKLIKASISRQRERLADASAVQFTRNPEGLAGALKKIGGLAEGSRICSPKAEQASHMFFGNGLGRSIFNTHPPLAERVKWLEPAFNGEFEEVTPDDLRAQLVRLESAPTEKEEEQKPGFADLFTQPDKVAVTAAVLDAASQPQFRPNNPEALIDSIGAPMEHHADAARKLIDSIPAMVKEFARDPYGARMLIYFLLLDSNGGIRDKQLAYIKEMAEPAVYETLKKALPNIGKIKPEMRLPIIDLSIPALRFLSTDQYAGFRDIVQALIDADEQVDIFEYALQRVLLHHLDPVFSGNQKSRTANYYAIRGLERETSIVLSVLARKGSDDPQEQAAAFAAAAGKIAAPKADFQFLEDDECGWENLDAALDKINEGSFKVKKWVLGAALACLMYDREITIAEVELFRAISDTLGCPVPPWVAPVAL